MFLARRICQGLLLLLGTALPPPLHAANPVNDELQLVAVLNGESTNKIVERDGEVVPLFGGKPPGVLTGVEWKLVGDLFSRTSRLKIKPGYWRVARERPLSGTGRPGRLRVSFSWTHDAERLRLDWDGGGIAVAAWVSEGTPVAVFPLAIAWIGTAIDRRADRTFTTFNLQIPEDCRSGVLMFLHYRGGAWIDFSSTSFGDEFGTAMACLYQGDRNGFAGAIQSSSRLNRLIGSAPATLLHLAAECGQTAAVEHLLERGADPAAVALKATPLEWAVRAGQVGVVSPLLAAYRGDPQRQRAIKRCYEDAVSAYLPDVAWLVHQAITHATEGDARRQMIARIAIETGDLATLEQIGTVPNAAGTSPFSGIDPGLTVAAAAIADPAFVRVPIAGGADPNGTSDGVSPLLQSVAANRVETIRALLKAGATVDHPGKDGTTPLISAIRHGHAAAMDELLEAGASIDLADTAGDTPLHHAVAAGSLTLVRDLLAHGAGLDRRNANDDVPLALALRQRAKAMIDLLVEGGARLPVAAAGFPHLLELCVEQDQLTLVQRAVADDWNPSDLLHGKWSVWRVAEFYGASTTTAWLEENTAYAGTAPALFRVDSVDAPPEAAHVQLGAEARFFYSTHLATGVEVSGVIDAEGRFLFPRVVSTPHPHLSKLVLEAVPTWTFHPARKGDAPVPVHVVLSVGFKADPKRKQGPQASRAQFRDPDLVRKDPGV